MNAENKKDLNNNSPIVKVFINTNEVAVQLADGRNLSIPRTWLNRPEFFNLNHTTDEQLKDYEIIGLGETIYFPKVEEALNIRTFTNGLYAHCN